MPRSRPLLRPLLGLVVLLPALLFLAAGPGTAKADVVVVPPGNRSAKQPPIPYSSSFRTAETKGTFDEKYRAVYALLSDPQLIGKIKNAAALYGIDPMHIVGAIVGEHTYNVDALDRWQDLIVKARAYANVTLSFGYDGESIADFVTRPQFAACNKARNDYELWSCREDVWRSKFQGKTVDGTAFADKSFQKALFQPLFAGQTFGLGQLSPLTALMVTDLVHERNPAEPLLDMNNAPDVYTAVMDPDRTLQYIAAMLYRDIEAYRNIAGFDISQNPGITATLYNLGDAAGRARELAAKNRKRRAAGQSVVYPQENYYGWLVNAHLDELRKLL